MSAMMGKMRSDGRFELLTDAAYTVLKERGAPMSAEEIAAEVKSRDSWRCPRHMDTDFAKGFRVGVGLEEKRHGEKCRFVKLSDKRFTLKTAS